MTKAVRFESYGGVDVLDVVKVQTPVPGPGQVLVDVRAAGTNPSDASIRAGHLDAVFPTTFPSGQGSDLAGVVAAVGPGVDTFVVGDEVLGWSGGASSQADAVVAPVGQLTPKPASLSWEVAGSLAGVGCTAYAAVRAVGAGPGDTVAVSAAAGGVGVDHRAAVDGPGCDGPRIASESNADWLRSVGVTPVAYGDGLADRLRAATPDGPDAFIDCFGPEYVHLAVDLGVGPDRIDTIISFALAGQLGAKTEGNAAAATPRILAEVAGLVADGRVTVPIAASYPLDRARDAYTELERRHTRGKIVLIP